jgi:seryl-tRNA synthetase
MIDRTLLREQPDYCKQLIHKKDPSFPIEQLISLERELSEKLREIEQLRHEKNLLAQCGAQMRTDESLRMKARALHDQLAAQETVLKELDPRFHDLYARCPNIPDETVPEGGKEANVVVKTWGEKPVFSFEPLHHVALNEKVGFFDFQAAVRMTGSQFVFYKNPGAKLIYALAMYMIRHNQKYGYELVLPPYLVNEATLFGASNFPRFRDAVYEIKDDQLFLTPTSEVNLTSLYRDHIFLREELPVRYTAWTSCFRREAGTYGAHERGLIRIHQFEKVELYTICSPEQAAAEHERMLRCAEELLQGLGLHYRVSLLAAQDSSFAATKTYDIEVWMPGQKAYYEVSSASNCSSFQARRSAIRCRDAVGEKTQYVSTLNTSSLAMPRLLVALMETYQQADGSIIMPEVLQRLMEFIGG